MTNKPGRKNDVRFSFFGTGDIARSVAEELAAAGLTPRLVVTAPDRARGRGLTALPSPVKQWADSLRLPVLQPEKVDSRLLENMRMSAWDVFIVADFGLILPRALLDIPARGTLNMHPSLLPRLRGPSPIRSAILFDEERVGVSVMLLDDKMDHGPLVAQRTVEMSSWPPHGKELDLTLAREGGRLLAQVLPAWVAGEIEAQEQQHDVATYTKKFLKEDGLLDLSKDPYHNLLKVRAFEGWPGTYAFFERDGKRIRVSVLDAHLEGGKFVVDSVKPEGKKEMPYQDFLRSGAKICT